MTDDRLLNIAKQIAVAAPARKGSYVSAARVPWEMIEDLRALMDELGFDWREGHKVYTSILRKNKAERYRKLYGDSKA